MELSLKRKTPLEANWSELTALTQERLQGKEREHYRNLLLTLMGDHQAGSKTLLGFRRAPAATGNHHAYEGGLVEHLLEMWQLWLGMRGQMSYPPYVDDQRVLKAIILHDLHKAYKTYELICSDPWQTKHADDTTDSLMTHDVKSMWLASRAGVELDPEQINALLWAEGGFSQTKPRWTSILAKVCYCLDELSGNGLARIANKTPLNVRQPAPT